MGVGRSVFGDNQITFEGVMMTHIVAVRVLSAFVGVSRSEYAA